MHNFFNGKLGLAQTYWIGVWGAAFLFRGIFYFINKGYLTITDDQDYARLEMVHDVVLVIISVYMLLMVRAMIMAGFDNRRPGGWGWIGIVLTTLSAAYICYTTIIVLFPSISAPKFMLEMEVRQLNKQLPQDMGDGMTMTRVDISGDTINYRVRVDEEIDEVDKLFYQIPLLETPEGKDVCEDFEGYFTGDIATIGYIYTYRNDVLRQELSGKDCLDWLADQR